MSRCLFFCPSFLKFHTANIPRQNISCCFLCGMLQTMALFLMQLYILTESFHEHIWSIRFCYNPLRALRSLEYSKEESILANRIRSCPTIHLHTSSAKKPGPSCGHASHQKTHKTYAAVSVFNMCPAVLRFARSPHTESRLRPSNQGFVRFLLDAEWLGFPCN